MALDRTGEPLQTPDPDEHECGRGWVGNPDDRHPCPSCRPWLVARPPRPPTKAELAAFEARHPAPKRTA